ncbi:MAG TPA: hypothetical protein PKI86_03780 [Chitinophagales bacterium]|nr:hypothetical protein [Chitinophagales bacterium]
MKTKILAITLFLIGTIVACKKVEEKISNPTYTDAELKIDTKSAFATEERKIKEGIMRFTVLDKKDRQTLIKNLVMENKHPKSIINGMDIFNKLSLKQQIELTKIILPLSNITIHNNITGKDEYRSIDNPTEFVYGRCWTTIKNSYQEYGCPGSGNDICYKYNPGC